MADIVIPKQLQGGFQKLQRLDEQSLAALLQALKSEEPMLFREDFARHVAQKVKTLSESDVKEIIDTLIGFRWGRESASLSTPEFVEQVLKHTDGLAEPQRALLSKYMVQ